MNRKSSVAALAACLGILILILDGKTALEGAASAVALCLKSVIPSLFPFLFLCAVLTDALWGASPGLLRYIGQHLGIPSGAESLLIPAFLGGYPAGAQAVGNAFREDRLNREEAGHLLTFCSNAGPAFLFGVAGQQFPSPGYLWSLWAIQLLSALIVGMLGVRTSRSSVALMHRHASIPDILHRTVRAMALICGWILLFGIITTFLDRWILFLFPEEFAVVTAGLLELAGGICKLRNIADISVRYFICSILLSFGGLCVTLQTASVIGTLSLKLYLRGKILQTIISGVLSLLYLQIGWLALAVPGILLLIPGKTRKRSGFPGLKGV